MSLTLDAHSAAALSLWPYRGRSMKRAMFRVLGLALAFAALGAVPAQAVADKGDWQQRSKAPGAHIGIAKQYRSGGVVGGNPVVILRFTIANYGTETITDLQVVEDLNAVYGAGNFVHVSDPEGRGGEGLLNYNAAFNGSTNTQMLGAGSSLAPGEFAIFEISSRITNVTDQGFGVGIYQNQVQVTGLGDGAAPVSDLSHEGDNPDPDANDDPTDNNDPTVIDVNDVSALGVALDATVSGNQVTFDVYLENVGSTNVSAVGLSNALDGVFGSGNYTLSTPVLIDDPGTLQLNPGFDAATQIDMLDPSGSSLFAGDTAQIRVVATVTTLSNAQGLGLGNHSHQVTVSGTSSNFLFLSDPSDFGTDPDPDGDSQPNEAGENDATTFAIGGSGVVGVALNEAVAGNQVTLDYYLENLGASIMSQLSLQSSLDAAFGAGNYTVLGAPSVITGSVSVNPAFNGGADTQILAAGNALTPGETAQIRVQLSVDNESDQGGGFGRYAVQANFAGTDPGGVVSSDRSDDGIDPDPNGNSDPSDGGEDDSTVVVISVNPVVGVAQRALVNGTQVTYELHIENLGQATLTNFLLQDPLNPVFGSGNYSIMTQPFLVSGPATLSLSPQFFGFNIFDRVVVGGFLRPGEVAVVRYVVNVNTVSDQGNGFGVYRDQVTISATAPDGSGVSDVSDDGVDPDPNGNGNPADAGESDQTAFAIGDEARLGIALSVNGSGDLATFDVYLENLTSSNAINNLSASLNLDAVFGSGNYAISSAPALIDDPGTLSLNAGFTGAGNIELLGAGSSLAALDTAQLRFIVQVTNVVDQGLGLGAFSAQAQASGTAPLGAAAFDRSDSGTDPDPNGNGLGNDAGEDDPSVFSLAAARIGIAKNAIVNGDEVTFEFRVENLGTASPGSISFTDNLDAVFGAGNYTLVQGPRAPILRDLIPNPAFTGSANTVVASGVVGAGQTDLIDLVVRVDQLADVGSGLGVYSNQSLLTADGETDLSDAGTDPDPDGDTDPSEPGEDDPTVFTIAQRPAIGAAHTAVVAVDQVTFDYYLENLGNVDAVVGLTHSLDAVFGAGNYSISVAPQWIDDPGTLTLNAGFDGSAQTALLSAGQLVTGDTARLRVVVEVSQLFDAGSGPGVYASQAFASGTAPNSSVLSDPSDAGTEPDADGDREPNEAGENDPTPLTVVLSPPSVPLSFSAVRGDQSAQLSFMAPASDGGRPVVNYEYSLNGGGSWTAFAPPVTTSPQTIPGLVNGTLYQIALRAVNSVGPGPATAAIAVTPAAVPGAPTNLVATPGDQQIGLSFTNAPANGDPISNYEYSLDGGGSWTAFMPAVTGSPVVITGLTNGVNYSLSLRAVNGVGPGLASAVVAATPATLPGAPTGLVASPGNQSASIAFTPAAANGSAVLNYEFSLDAGASWTPFAPPVATSPVSISGLTNGVSYAVQLRAINGVGTGPASATVNVVPAAVPDAPTGLAAVSGDQQITVSFVAGADNGAAITGYQYSLDGGLSWLTFSPPISMSPGVISGLINGTSYNIVIRAVSSVGPSAASATVTATPAGVPLAPLGLAANGQDGALQLTYSPGADNGSALLNHEYSLDDGLTWTAFAPPVTGSPATISGLVNGQAYVVRLRGVNAVGAGAASASVTATPFTTPSAPRNVTVSTPPGQAVVSWLAPLDNGGLPITRYEVTAQPGGRQCVVTGSPPPTTCAFTSLPAGVYTFSVIAINGGGSVSGAAVSAPGTVTSLPTVIPVGSPWALLLMGLLLALLGRQALLRES